MEKTPHLKRSLTPLMLWGIGVGNVISGMYFGWNLGLPEGGTGGLALATVAIIILYITFIFSYTELACAIPKAGGVFDYASLAMGADAGFMAGMAQFIEFVFTPPAIAAALGAYFHIFFPQIPISVIAVSVFVVFTALNILGVKAAAIFELVITGLAVGELLLFAGVTLPHFSLSNLTINAWPHGFKGVWAAIPFAIWFLLGLEGMANVAEETINPQRNILRGFGSALFTLIVLCIITFVSSIGIAGWESVVYPSPGAAPSDSPLPLALSHITGNSGWLYHLLISIGLLGLIASFHGILMAAGRSGFEFGRAGYFPKAIGVVHSKFKTPANALLLNMTIGITIILTSNTANIIIMACFGALSLMGFGMCSVLFLRKKMPDLPRPYRVPFYPWFPRIALVISAICFIAMISIYPIPFFWYAGIMLAAYLGYVVFVKKNKQHIKA